MPLILGANSASGGYTIKNSARFNVASTDYLIRTIASTGSSQIWTASGWTKRQQLGASSSLYCSSDTSAGNNFRSLFINASDQVQCAFIAGTYTFQVETNALLRDVSAWYHIVASVDTTQATASDRVKIWINGVLQTSFATASYPTQNATINFSTSGYKQLIASLRDSSSILNGCYLAEMHILDGVAKQASDFGETDTDTGIWKPKAYSGSYGTNGFYLKFANSASLGTDSSGNGNTFTVNNLTSVDQSTDTPTNNFATWNPLWVWNDSGTIRTPTYTDGNLISVFDDGGNNEMALSTFGASVGKWYAEIKCNPYNGFYPANTRYGILDISYSGTTAPSATAYIYQGNGQKRVSNTASSYGNTYTTGDIIGIAMDLDNGYLYFSKNGTFQNSGVPTSGATGTGGISISTGVTYGIYSEDFNFSQNGKAEANFGSPTYSANSYTDGAGYGNFSYAVPSGYYALNTKNLATYG